jgi:UDP-glucose 4-epimerase
VVPKVRRLRTQGVHADDVGEAYRLAVVGDARGPFNLAADPVLDADILAGLLDAGAGTPPLDPRAGGPLRLGEFRTGVGGGGP